MTQQDGNLVQWHAVQEQFHGERVPEAVRVAFHLGKLENPVDILSPVACCRG